jgi:hypothetical protein
MPGIKEASLLWRLTDARYRKASLLWKLIDVR